MSCISVELSIVYVIISLMLFLQKPDSGVEKRRHEDFVVWQCAVTLSGDVRVEFWDHDRFSDVSAT